MPRSCRRLLHLVLFCPLSKGLQVWLRHTHSHKDRLWRCSNAVSPCSKTSYIKSPSYHVCVCVCVCERERTIGVAILLCLWESDVAKLPCYLMTRCAGCRTVLWQAQVELCRIFLSHGPQQSKPAFLGPVIFPFILKLTVSILFVVSYS